MVVDRMALSILEIAEAVALVGMASSHEGDQNIVLAVGPLSLA